MTIKFVKSLLGFILSNVLAISVFSQELTVFVYDQNNQPVADAVVEIVSPLVKSSPLAEPSHVAQEGLVFVPFVTAVQRGTLIDFPNRDKTRHHVYSFSSAKTFEIQLYSGIPADPIQFDEPGIVVLGCNIHDYMLAYIYVGESPLLSITDREGKAHFKSVPASELGIKLWHPWQLGNMAEQRLTPAAGGELTLKLPVTAQEKPKAPKRGFGS